MSNGSLIMPKSVHFVRRLLSVQWVVTLWLADVAKVFAICVLSLGSPTIRTTSSVTSINKSPKNRSANSVS